VIEFCDDSKNGKIYDSGDVLKFEVKQDD